MRMVQRVVWRRARLRVFWSSTSAPHQALVVASPTNATNAAARARLASHGSNFPVRSGARQVRNMAPRQRNARKPWVVFHRCSGASPPDVDIAPVPRDAQRSLQLGRSAGAAGAGASPPGAGGARNGRGLRPEILIQVKERAV